MYPFHTLSLFLFVDVRFYNIFFVKQIFDYLEILCINKVFIF
ncbi:hypothetical protein HFN_1095 [Helicobacter fennelliae MRY12-0050]|uniref:Uncharacterized protein n=1 Tax=Helicobacter fennelliae MRY12-0050 TaxID=1325130 RepID=T1D0W7_9HELI|nr:hypothetical protein HFN_1095 [Helicobacter fennelliae MRY12-0050]